MNRVLILTAIVFLSVVMISCGGDDNSCPGDNEFCHFYGGLNWSDVAPNRMIWDKAVKYCDYLGGRLPTISELRTLIKNCSATEAGGECGVTDSCLAYDDLCRNDACEGCSDESDGRYSELGGTDWLWSSSERSDYKGCAWTVNFDSGYVNWYSMDSEYYVRCVK